MGNTKRELTVFLLSYPKYLFAKVRMLVKIPPFQKRTI